MPVVETSTIDPSDHNGRVIVGVASGGPGEAAFHLVLERGSEVSFSSQASGDQGARHETSPGVHFDATERRKARLRGQAQSRTAPPASDPARAETRQPTDPAESPRPKHRLAPREAPAAMRPNPPSETPPAAHASPGIAPASAPLDEAALDKLLIHFVVEQTGYPEEIVDMEADLEADLGIDSIKKAQLFGELRELFDVADSDDLSLDDFSTLGHIREFLLLQATPKSNTPVAAPSKSPPASAALASDVPADPSRQSAPGASELEAFLVNFVVEQTGYPEDIVELDADLEADLGIDSIKKAQLFGELREHFGIEAPDDGDALPADFPTLRHVMAFLQQHGAPAV
jgi:acyl carrier protein